MVILIKEVIDRVCVVIDKEMELFICKKVICCGDKKKILKKCVYFNWLKLVKKD